MYSFIETKLFSRLVAQYLTDGEYSRLQHTLIKDPEAGDLIPGSGGIRKFALGCGWSWTMDSAQADCDKDCA
jgi:hypothetical protein